MRNYTIGSKSLLLKAVCLAMVIVLGAGMFGAGAMASADCGMTCCCHSDARHMQSSAEMQMRSPMGCCTGTPLKSCDLQSSTPFELPEITMASSNWDLPNAGGSTVVLSGSNDYRQSIGSKTLSQVLDPNFDSPPLYLQKLNFLI
jgi:hypothetical protein